MKSGLLLSGGMDSLALAFWKKPHIAFTVDYGQLPSQGEIRAAQAITQALGIEHLVIQHDYSALGSGDLVGTVPNEYAPASDWWPYRNQLLITLVAAKAISVGVGELMVGTVRTDAIHSDGTAAFVEAMDRLLSLQEGRMRIIAPAIELSCAELVRTSRVPMGLLAWAHSCHVSEFACGQCRGCNKHREAMRELGYEDY